MKLNHHHRVVPVVQGTEQHDSGFFVSLGYRQGGRVQARPLIEDGKSIDGNKFRGWYDKAPEKPTHLILRIGSGKRVSEYTYPIEDFEF